MTINEKLDLLEEVLDIKQGTLSEDIELDTLGEWDSMAAISIIAMFDEKYGQTLTTKDVKSFRTVKDITDLME
ncbi:MAG: Phosphopantetheine attachment site [Firmicutes bacterium ADurb.Bin419]|nr:MAG: Phosphopantetheine attachment site [Firmicutes bacterium ADurb.Bin419]